MSKLLQSLETILEKTRELHGNTPDAKLLEKNIIAMKDRHKALNVETQKVSKMRREMAAVGFSQRAIETHIALQNVDLNDRAAVIAALK